MISMFRCVVPKKFEGDRGCSISHRKPEGFRCLPRPRLREGDYAAGLKRIPWLAESGEPQCEMNEDKRLAACRPLV